MSNEKHYPLHPNATNPPTMTCEIPLEEYESLKRENAELKDKLQATEKQLENFMNSASCLMVNQDKANDKLADELAELREAHRWRKFPEEKPKEDTWCIVFHDGEIDSDHYTRFTYNKKCDFALYGNEVTHWMPLPKEPEEG